ncbi:hypothetical protein ACFQY7_04985 [Actinomadura luteofluorescens]|uniref:hypothetical protein n=1 Tax=Actinomadura luteofluorescens TaxID=46163 RepID=UPI003626BEBD
MPGTQSSGGSSTPNRVAVGCSRRTKKCPGRFFAGSASPRASSAVSGKPNSSRSGFSQAWKVGRTSGPVQSRRPSFHVAARIVTTVDG